MYEVLSECSENVCKPTTLYGLEPIGIGTAFVESLSSYVTRLAAAHMVPPSALMRYVIADKLDYTKHNLGVSIGNQKIVKSMNGMGIEASILVNCLEKLTGQTDLKYTTMLPFSSLISQYDLVSPISAWCPYCFNHQRVSGQAIHIPLLWCLSNFWLCEIHDTPLLSICPKCRSSSPILASRTVAGYCSKCFTWLGLPQIDHFNIPECIDDNKFSTRLIEAGFLAHNTGKSNFPSMLKYLLGNKMKISEFRALARLLERSKSTIISWVTGYSLPKLQDILMIADKFGMDPMDILITDGDEMFRRDQETVTTISCMNDVLSHIDWNQLYGLLKDVAGGKASAMRVEDIARVYKCFPEQITYKYPELCTAIESRFNKITSNR